MFVECCFCVLVITYRVTAFSHGAPDFSCKDPSTFHTRRINATHEGIIMPEDIMISPYSLVIDSKIFKPGEKITVTLKSNDAKSPLRGFFLQAIQAGIHLRDLHRRPFGRFENTTADERPSVCQSFRSAETTGITHSNSRGKPSVSVIWIAPLEYNPGEIQFLATGVLDYATYWTDIRSERIVPEGYTERSENGIRGGFSQTATWFRWLQYLRHQQLLNKTIRTTNKKNGAGHDHSEAGHTHIGHAHHHDHSHDHSHSAIHNADKVTQTETKVQSTTVTMETTTV